jgi:hypothetical protein
MIGIQFDSSFHQHGPQLLAGSYGVVFTNDLLTLMNYVFHFIWLLLVN